jgi:hypothetical protein
VSVVANVAINVDSSGAVSKLRQVQTQAQQTEKAFDGIAAAVGKLAIAFGGIQAAKFIFVKTAELESQTKSLEVLTGSVQKAKSIIAELQQLGAVTPFTSTELIDAAKRLNAFGVEGDKVVETTRRLADVSGATGAELQGLVTAYGQVQAKGRLQGEELLQFQERGIALQEELQKMYGLSGEELRKALSKGQISAEAVEVAVKRLTDTGGKYANGAIAQSETLQGKFSTLTDGVEQLARTIGLILSPALKAILTQAIRTLDVINAVLAAGRGGGITRNLTGANAAISIGATSEGVDRIAKGIGQISNQKNKAGIQQNLQALTNYQTTLQRIGANDPNANRAVQLQGVIQQKIQQNLTAQKQFNAARANMVKPTEVPALLEGVGAGKPKKADDGKRIAEQIRTSKLQLTLAQDIFAIEGRLQEAQLAGNDQLVLARNAQKELAQIASQRADVITNKEMPALAKKNALDKLAIEAATVSRKLGFDLVKIEQNRTKSFGEIIADLEFELKLKSATTEEAREQLRLENELRKLKGQGFTPQQISAIAQKKGELAKPQTDAEKVQARINALQTEITQLTNIGNIAIKVADGIGAAFGQAFEGLITGSMTAQEALGNFFKSIGSMFIQMATEIIAKQMVMVTLGFIMKALGLVGSISSAGNAAGAAAFSPGNAASLDAIPGQAFSLPKLAANGAIFSNGIAKFASGGIVGSPTLFPFANGGAMQMGLMGEAGPEAIMPLQRGADGSLGVRAAMGGNGMGGSSSPVLNMSFETSTINGVEYVSRDQLEAAMAQTRRQASSDGAKRGMAMTLDRIQQSPQTRRRIGM